ncbi:nuclear transport factor 2 family protein [Actinoalloteichus hymeniacidonis]|uniref:Ketosteroid isomerase-like protein n=1 Tax=Actinoalloteichus hymeniacidonis TaxID=340345 RepID=A0AAC9MXJ4_9PSEU|nr:nuclear transport factor 2 family protein [Actinoalloteichus hymeniacidonis]AOS62101.1 ketosteroid isomerase-like protein [Actinoalloteichus hymeniacidonis]MBB5909877.1 ketosteroid isomerase-like protein [Actinoalloteichus hymeniacidonis]
MYHRFVARRVRAVFAEISAGNWEPMVEGMASDFTYHFHGDHALSGERHTKAALRAWWERCFRLMPSPTFRVEEVLVTGPPWATRVATRVTVSAQILDGSDYENVVTQFLRMRWGKITEVRTLEDTVVLQRVLDRLAAAGIAEAHAAPITG